MTSEESLTAEANSGVGRDMTFYATHMNTVMLL